jgi:hypothetical protein
VPGFAEALAAYTRDLSSGRPTILSETLGTYRAKTHALGFSSAGGVALLVAGLIGVGVAVSGTVLVAIAPDEDQLSGLAILLCWAAGAVVAALLGFVVWVVDAAAHELRKAADDKSRSPV